MMWIADAPSWPRYILLALLAGAYLFLESTLLPAPAHSCPARLAASPPGISSHSSLPSLNGSTLLRSALFSTPAPMLDPAFAPFTGLSHALGYRTFSPSEMLQCIASVGGLTLVGDSTLREATTVLLEYLGRPRIKVNGVAWENQRADEQFLVEMPGGGTAQARLHFLFARNINPELARRISEAALTHDTRAIVAHSAFWDWNVDTGASAEDWLACYMRGAARCLQTVRTELAPALAAQDSAAGTPLPPRRWLWRTANPTVLGRLDEGRRTFLTPARVHASNAFIKAALAASSAAGGYAPVWEVVDMADIVPSGREDLVREDGYHPTDPSALATVQLIFNKLCGQRVTSQTLEEMAA